MHWIRAPRSPSDGDDFIHLLNTSSHNSPQRLTQARQSLGHVNIEVDHYFGPRPLFDFEILPFPWSIPFSSSVLLSPPPLRSSSIRPRRPPFRRRGAQITYPEPSNAALNSVISTTDLSPILTQNPDIPPTSLFTNDTIMAPQPMDDRNAPPTITPLSALTKHNPASSTSVAISSPSNTVERSPNHIDLIAVPPQDVLRRSNPSASPPETSCIPPIGIASHSPTTSSLRVNAAIIPETIVKLDGLLSCPSKKAEDALVVKAPQIVKERMVHEKAQLQDEKCQPSVKRKGSMTVRVFKIRGFFKRRIGAWIKDKPCESAKVVRIPCASEIAMDRAREDALLEGHQNSENANQKAKKFSQLLHKDNRTYILRKWKKSRFVMFGRRERKGKAFESYAGHDAPFPDRYKEPVIIRYNVHHMSRPPLDWDSDKATYALGPASQCCDDCARRAEKVCQVLRIPSPAREISASAVLDSASASVASVLVTLSKNGLEAGLNPNTRTAGHSGGADMEELDSKETGGNSDFSSSLDGPSDSSRSSHCSVKHEDQKEKAVITVDEAN